MIVIMHKANIAPALTEPFKNLHKNVLYSHLQVQSNGVAVTISATANIKSPSAKSATSLLNLPLLFHVFKAMSTTAAFPNTPIADTVTLKIPSTLSQYLVQVNILASRQKNGTFSQVHSISEILAKTQNSCKDILLTSIVVRPLPFSALVLFDLTVLVLTENALLSSAFKAVNSNSNIIQTTLLIFKSKKFDDSFVSIFFFCVPALILNKRISRKFN